MKRGFGLISYQPPSQNFLFDIWRKKKTEKKNTTKKMKELPINYTLVLIV